jgi:NgoPII restriction endonuclease
MSAPHRVWCSVHRISRGVINTPLHTIPTHLASLFYTPSDFFAFFHWIVFATMAIVPRMTNTLRAIIHMLQHHRTSLNDMMPSANRMNDMGRSCEQFVKDMFSELPSDLEEQAKLLRYAEVFSYQGNQNHPPDLILKNGDALEIKKIESRNPNLALNSSYPKHKLYAHNKRILASCKNCEANPWDVKDIVYVFSSFFLWYML